MQSISSAPLTRRHLIQSAALMAGGFALGICWPAGAAQLVGAAGVQPLPGQIGLNAWVRIQADNIVTVIVSQAEIGQGISTTLPAILVDELGADWARVQTETAPFDDGQALRQSSISVRIRRRWLLPLNQSEASATDLRQQAKGLKAPT